MTNGWLDCSDNDVFKKLAQIKNFHERLQKFHEFLSQEEMTIDEMLEDEMFYIIDKMSLKKTTEFYLFERGDIKMAENEDIIYWFFNVFTGEVISMTYSLKCCISKI